MVKMLATRYGAQVDLPPPSNRNAYLTQESYERREELREEVDRRRAEMAEQEESGGGSGGESCGKGEL